MFKRKLSVILCICSIILAFNATAQTTVTIGNGTSNSTSQPIYTFNNYSATESIYKGAEFGGQIGNITAIAYDKASGSSTQTIPNVTIYMKLVSDTTTGSSNRTISLSGYTQVWSGTFPNSASGWQEVTFDVPFSYADNTKSISVLVVNNSGTTIASGRPAYRYTSVNSTKKNANYSGAAAWNEAQTLSSVWERPNTKFTFQPLAGCIAPVNVQVGNIQATSATVSWSSPTIAPDGFEWEIRTSGAAGSGNVGLVYSNTTTNNSVDITGLMASTSYIFYIRSVCGGSLHSYWVSSNSFTTPCQNISSYPWSENFDALNVNSCWGNVSSGNTHWDFVTTDASHGASTTHNGNGMARVDVYNATTSNNPMILTLPVFNFSANAYTLSYWSFIGSGGDASPLIVEYSTNGGNTFTVLKTHDNTTNVNQWSQATLQITGVSNAAVIIRFRAKSNYGSGTTNINLDDISIVPSAALPIRLIDIKATAQQGRNLINWHTASETKGNIYTLEKQVDNAKQFVPVFDAKVSESNIAGAEYSFNDKDIDGTTALYRLRMKNEAGGESFSKIVAVKNNLVQTAGFSIYPNPAIETVTISNLTDFNGNVVIRNMNGVVVQSIYAMNSKKFIISLESLPTGMYSITYGGTTKTIVKK